jgi:hypothetical protein
VNKIKSMLAAIVLLCTSLMGAVLVASPANGAIADDVSVSSAKDTTWGGKVKIKAWGTDVTHAADDSGYTAAIHIQCTNGTHRWLYRGEGTFLTPDKACGYGGVQWIITGADQAVRCFNALPPYGSHYFIGGYREVPSYASLKCYMQRPI